MYTNEEISRTLFYNGVQDFYSCYWYKPGKIRPELTLEEAVRLSQENFFRQVSEERLEEELGEIEAKASRYRNFRQLLETDIPEMFGIYPPRGCINQAILELENGRSKIEVAGDIKNQIIKDYPSKPVWIDDVKEVPTLVTAYKNSIIVAMSKKPLSPTHKREMDSMLEDLGTIVRLAPDMGLDWFFLRLNSIRLRVSNIFYYVIRQNLEKIERRIILLLTTYFCPQGLLFGEYRQHYKVVYPEVIVQEEEEEVIDEEIVDLMKCEKVREVKDCYCGRKDKVVAQFEKNYKVEFCTYGMDKDIIEWYIRYNVFMHYKMVGKELKKVDNKRERKREWMKRNIPKELVRRIPYALSDYYDVLLGDREKGNNAQVDPRVYQSLRVLGYDREGFAAPFNHSLPNWYSLCSLDRFLGSRGSFFDEENDGKFLLNPPYELYVIDKMLISLREGSKYVIFLPDKEKVRELLQLRGFSIQLLIPHKRFLMRQFWEKDRNFGDAKDFEPVNDVLIVLKGQEKDEENAVLKLLTIED